MISHHLPLEELEIKRIPGMLKTLLPFGACHNNSIPRHALFLIFPIAFGFCVHFALKKMIYTMPLICLSIIPAEASSFVLEKTTQKPMRNKQSNSQTNEDICKYLQNLNKTNYK